MTTSSGDVPEFDPVEDEMEPSMDVPESVPSPGLDEARERLIAAGRSYGISCAFLGEDDCCSEATLAFFRQDLAAHEAAVRADERATPAPLTADEVKCARTDCGHDEASPVHAYPLNVRGYASTHKFVPPLTADVRCLTCNRTDCPCTHAPDSWAPHGQTNAGIEALCPRPVLTADVQEAPDLALEAAWDAYDAAMDEVYFPTDMTRDRHEAERRKVERAYAAAVRGTADVGDEAYAEGWGKGFAAGEVAASSRLADLSDWKFMGHGPGFLTALLANVESRAPELLPRVGQEESR